MVRVSRMRGRELPLRFVDATGFERLCDGGNLEGGAAIQPVQARSRGKGTGHRRIALGSGKARGSGHRARKSTASPPSKRRGGKRFGNAAVPPVAAGRVAAGSAQRAQKLLTSKP